MTKLSFTTMGTPEWDAAGAIRAAKEYGYQGVDLRVSDFKGELTLDASAEEISTTKKLLQDHGIELAGLLCYNAVGSEGSGSWDNMKKSLLKHLELGMKLSSPAIRMFGGNPNKDIPRSEFMKRSADAICSVLENFKERIDIVLQNHGGSYSALDGIELIQLVNNPRFGLVFSPDHCLVMEEDFQDVFSVVKPYSKQLYVSDIEFYSEEAKLKHRSILPGEGAVPIKEAYEAIGDRNFGGFVSFKWEKIWNDYLPGPEVALPHFIEFWKARVSED